MIGIQVTLFSTTGKYKPVSTIIKVNSLEEYEKDKSKQHQRAIANICHQRYWRKS